MSLDISQINKDGWNKLIRNGKKYSNTSLPEYGPFMENEEKLRIFDDIENKKVIEFGCAKGDSLKYLKSKGASEVWGVDISEEQIRRAEENLNQSNNLFVSEMENNPGIPTNYFDYVLSLYSIGYSSNIEKTMDLSYEYLRKDGKFVLCWTHPFFYCLGLEDDKIIVSRSYNDESVNVISKGEDKIPMAQYNFKISTLINNLIKSGFIIDKIIEENPISENHIGDYKSNFWDSRKLSVCPTTLIIVAHK